MRDPAGRINTRAGAAGMEAVAERPIRRAIPVEMKIVRFQRLAEVHPRASLLRARPQSVRTLGGEVGRDIGNRSA